MLLGVQAKPINAPWYVDKNVADGNRSKLVDITLFTTIDQKPVKFYLKWDENAYSKEPVDKIKSLRGTIEVNN